MSRSCYSDDFGDDFPGQMELYRANVERSIRGAFGQQRLKELRDALRALPVKELQADIFATGSNEAPQVCALGAWALAKCGGDVEKAREMVRSDDDDHDTAEALKSHGWPRLVVFDTIYQNDQEWSRFETPARRYERVLAWVESQILTA